MPLTLEADNMKIIKWWIDASSFAVHSDMKNYNGGAMTLGKGMIYATSTRQKTIPSFTIYRLTLFDRTTRETFSFPATLLSSIASEHLNGAASICYLKPSKVDRNISNSPTLFPTPPW